MMPFLSGRFVFNQNSEIAQPRTKFFWESIKYVCHDINKTFPLHTPNLHDAFWRDFNESPCKSRSAPYDVITDVGTQVILSVVTMLSDCMHGSSRPCHVFF